MRALVQEQLGRVFQVSREGEHGLRHAVIDSLACFAARAGAIGASVVGGERAAVVVAEFDHDVVARLQDVGDGLEPAFAGIRASAASADGFVGNRDGDVGGDVLAPACRVLREACHAPEGNVPSVPDPPPAAAMVESPAR